jgi:hypothetical protein
MSAPKPHEPDAQIVRRLLRLAAAPAIQPADLLLDHAMSQSDDGWITRALDHAHAISGAAGPHPSTWTVAAPTPEWLRIVRSASKRRFESSSELPARCEALLGYAWCLAACLVHHGHTGSTETRDQVDGLLGATAAVVPHPMREFLSQAILIGSDERPRA